MNVLIVYWHPEPQSFNHAMLETAVHTLREAGHSVQVSDLNAMDFQAASNRANFETVKNPAYFIPQAEEEFATETGGFAPEVEAEIAKLEWCDLMVWQFPLWWFGLPGVLKGWVDRTYARGRIYGAGRTYENGSQRGKRAMLSLTTGGPPEAYEPGGVNGDMMGVLRPIQRGMFRYVGFDVLAPHIVYGPARMDDAGRKAELARFAARLGQIGDETPLDVGQY